MTGLSGHTTRNSDAVFFDVGNTLLRAKPSVAAIYQRTASKYGVLRSTEEIEAAFKRKWQESKLSADFLKESGRRGPDAEKKWWKQFVRGVFENFEPIRDYNAFFEELFDIFARSESWELFPEVVEVLSNLKSDHYRLGVISNWDSRLPGILHGLRVDRFFLEIVISSQVGCEKPDRRIFHLAAQRLSVPIEKCVHIGDDPILDYRGALEAGMFPILLDRTHTDHRDMRTIGDLRSLLTTLP